ncbi:MAG: hypothetical protein RIC16_16130 [Rhodospirillales bacterium]
MAKPPDGNDTFDTDSKGDLDDGGLSPEDVLLAAIRQSRRETIGTEPPGESGPEEPGESMAVSDAEADAPVHHLPMIDRKPAPAASHAEPVARPTGTPFAKAPPILPQNDSGAGMGFEFSLARRPGRRNR